MILAGKVRGQVAYASLGDDRGQGSGGGWGDGGPAGDLVVGLVVEHGQVERLEQLLFDPVRQVRQNIPQQGQGIEQGGVSAVVGGLLGQGGELGVDLVALGF